MLIYVEQEDCIVLCGKLVSTKWGIFERKSKEFWGEMEEYEKGLYEVITQNPNFLLPTGQPAAQEIRWLVYASEYAAFLANPKNAFDVEYVIIEGTLIHDHNGDPWHTASGQPRTTFKVKAQNVQDMIDREELINHIEYHPVGSHYSAWWRPRLDAPPIVDDYEFMYEDEAWSRND